MPRRPEQFEEIREKSREKIISAALELFANKGYEATSIDSIAKKAGISKGLIYNYYESKKSILLSIFEDAMRQGEILINKQKEISDSQLKIKGIIDTMFDMIGNNPEYLKLLMVISLQPGVMEDTHDFTDQMFKRNQDFIGAIFNTGEKKDPIKGLILDALMDGIMINYIRYGNQYPLAELHARMIKDFAMPMKKEKAGKNKI